MAPDSQSRPRPPETRGLGTELWLLRPGPREDLETRLAVFSSVTPAWVLGPTEGDAAHWAEAFAAALGAPLELLAELDSLAEGAAREAQEARGWNAIEACLTRGAQGQPILALLPFSMLRSVVARALGFPLARASSLRVDPGRAVLLRDDSIGMVLRHTNVLGPEATPGTALPGVGAETTR